MRISATVFSKAIQEVTPTMVLTIDRDSQRIVFSNTRFTEITGFAKDRVINSNIFAYIHRNDYIHFADALEQLSNTTKSNAEYEISILDVNNDPIDVILYPRYQSDQPNYLFLFFNDNRLQYKKNKSLDVYRQIFSSTKEMMALIDTDLHYHTVNKSYLDHYGVTEESIINTPVKDMHGDNADFIIKNIKHTLETGEQVRIQPQIKDVLSNTGLQHVDVLYSPYYDDQQRIIGVIVSARNITSFKEQEAEIRKKMHYYETLFQHSPDLLASVNLNTGEIIECNLTLEKTLGYQQGEISGRHIFEFHSQPDNASIANAIAKLKRGEMINGLEVSLLSKSKETVDSHLRTTPLVDIGDNVAVFVWRDIRNQKKLAYRASHDPLTELLNRSGFLEVLKQPIPNKQKNVLCYLDIDNFKQLNDQFGHLKGDDFLTDLARILTNTLGEKDYICRIGGDEFVILIKNSLPELVEVSMNSILNQVKEVIRNTEEYKNLDLGLSIGITDFTSAEPIKTAVQRADSACYASKSKGKHTITIIDSSQTDIKKPNEKSALLASI